ncbi:uncharacterized protein [Triticum aestivum]|uniref:uncharacterized protein n=1 Tax=Triticum aestivum TaxID=4565 RepID=UPI001D0186B2|nr:uncharacterized protein LOC123089864 [Triticum aestivum]
MTWSESLPELRSRGTSYQAKPVKDVTSTVWHHAVVSTQESRQFHLQAHAAEPCDVAGPSGLPCPAGKKDQAPWRCTRWNMEDEDLATDRADQARQSRCPGDPSLSRSSRLLCNRCG